ncbi:DUF2254 domain-containing protein [Serinicoccus sp. CUA-874]|uniref:DUF2254 domain-containing protein n=1 Tax=Serinicoccus sp. CUA-874 TaxID=1517939 RepID=UPI000B015654|nr:DUF2254 domain-containing protein [Serinicoccus sp. CUA-874]
MSEANQRDSRHEDTEELDDVGVLPRTRSITRWDRFWRPFWMLPTVIVVLATVTGALLPEWEKTFDEHLPFVFQGGPGGARDMLGNIAGAMISVTGLVFSITMVVVQLASSQFSPRVLSDFLSSRITQATLGIFAATFTYALTVLRSVRGDTGDITAFVPQISITLGFLLVLASVAMFLAFIHHITTSIQVSSIVSHLGESTMAIADRYFPRSDDPTAQRRDARWDEPEQQAPLTVESQEHGYVVEIDHRSLVSWATERDAVVQVLTPVGRYVTEGAPALRVWGLDVPGAPVTVAEHRDDQEELESELDLATLRRAVAVEQDRAFNQDPAVGMRKLVDIAERALSPGINDPTTASQVMDEIHRILRRVVTRRDLPRAVRHDGIVRLVHTPQRVEELIDLALEEVLHYAENSLQVPRQVLFIIERLRPVALPEYAEALDHWERVAEQIVERARADDEAAPTEQRA